MWLSVFPWTSTSCSSISANGSPLSCWRKENLRNLSKWPSIHPSSQKAKRIAQCRIGGCNLVIQEIPGPDIRDCHTDLYCLANIRSQIHQPNTLWKKRPKKTPSIWLPPEMLSSHMIQRPSTVIFFNEAREVYYRITWVCGNGKAPYRANIQNTYRFEQWHFRH